MKKIIFAILMSAMLTMTACDSEEPKESTKPSQTETVGNVTEQPEEEEPKVEEKKNTLNYSFANVGNNPNNFWHTSFAPAFDNNYIYYIHDGMLDDSIYRVDYSGQNAEKLVSECTSYLNVYDGYIYYTLEGSTKDGSYLRIMRCGTLAGEPETVFEINGKKYSDNTFTSVIISNGYLFCASKSGTLIMAIDLSDITKQYYLYSEINDRDVAMTCDNNGNVYFWIKTDSSNQNHRKVLSVNVGKIKDYEMPRLVVDSKELPVFATFVQASDGYMSYKSGYSNYLFADINEEETKWLPAKDDYAVPEKDSFADKILGARNQRFVLDNTLFLIVTDPMVTGHSDIGGTDEGFPVYMFADMDLTSPVQVTRIKGLNFASNFIGNVFGTYNNKFYAVETVNKTETLVEIDAFGNVTKTPISYVE